MAARHAVPRADEAGGGQQLLPVQLGGVDSRTTLSGAHHHRREVLYRESRLETAHRGTPRFPVRGGGLPPPEDSADGLLVLLRLRRLPTDPWVCEKDVMYRVTATGRNTDRRNGNELLQLLQRSILRAGGCVILPVMTNRLAITLVPVTG